MKNEVEYSTKKFAEAVNRLQEGIAEAENELDRDGVIQRFEFTFELMWKTIKVFLEEKGILCKSPKDCLQQAFKYGLITDEQLFLEMLSDRNKTSHVYNKSTSDKIYNNIAENYASAIGEVLKNIQAK